MSSRISSLTFFFCGAGGVWEWCNRSRKHRNRCRHAHALKMFTSSEMFAPQRSHVPKCPTNTPASNISTFHSQFEYFTCSNEAPINILKLCFRKLNKFQLDHRRQRLQSLINSIRFLSNSYGEKSSNLRNCGETFEFWQKTSPCRRKVANFGCALRQSAA